MVNYEVLGFDSQEDYFNKFFNTLLPTNHNFEYFVNWDKVFKNVKDHSIEISILNSLSKVDEKDLETEFRKIINCYPEVVPILPSILAIRVSKKDIKVDVLEESFKLYNFNADQFNEEDILYFSKKSGLLNLFTKINDLYAYLLGTEVGLDTNGRKNRSGTIFEAILEKKLNYILKDTGYVVKSQEFVDNISTHKRADFIITKNNEQVMVIECNYYSGGGSKPSEVIRAYGNLQTEVNKINLKFLWITDGLGWNKMANAFKTDTDKVDFVANYAMMEESVKRILNL